MHEITSGTSVGGNSPVQVWDWPVRLTHWLLVFCFFLSWSSAEQRAMEWHRWSGYSLLGLLTFRVYWGFVGSSSARFSQFMRRPRELVAYLRGPHEVHRDAGHNPLGGWSVAAMLTAMLAQVLTGLFVSDVDGLDSGPLSYLISFDATRTLAKVHELMFSAIVTLISLHIGAIVFYTLVRREQVIVAMFTGQRRDLQVTAMRPVRSWRILPGVVLAIVVVYLVANATR